MPVPLDQAVSTRLLLRDDAYARLRDAILDGTLEAGEQLRDGELSAWLGISRTPIREALVLLQNEGLVEAPPNRGAFVRSYDAADLEDVYNLRAVLEGYAARTAASRITPGQIHLLEESCDRYRRLREATETLPELVDENFTFHTIIVQAAGSRRLESMIRNITAVPLIYKSYMEYSDDNRRHAEEDHRAVAVALKAGDGEEAGRLLEKHILWARDLAVAHLPLITPDRPAVTAK
jgi:DNA-binding GntR family transcriptional regulator